MMVTGTSSSQIEDLKRALDIAFTIKGLGQLTCFLGIEIHRIDIRIFLSLKKYILKTLVQILAWKIVSLLLILCLVVWSYLMEGNLLAEPDVYRRLVGRLCILGITIRPALSHFVQHLS